MCGHCDISSARHGSSHEYGCDSVREFPQMFQTAQLLDMYKHIVH